MVMFWLGEDMYYSAVEKQGLGSLDPSPLLPLND